MATREASIRVTMKRGSFNQELRSMVGKTRTAGRAMGKALEEPMSKGIEGAKRKMGQMTASIKGAIGAAMTLGGALSLGAAIKIASDAQKKYLQLSTALSTFSDESYSAADAQEIVSEAAARTSVDVGTLQNSLMQLAGVAGKTDNIGELLVRAANQARRLGVEGEFIARVYTRMVAKGVATTGEEVENLTEQFNTLFRTMLGVDIDEAIDPMDVAELAGFINTTGNSAAEMLKFISLGGEKIAKDFGKANEMVEELGLSLKQAKGVEEMRKKLKLKKGVIDENKTALENMLAIADLGPKKFAAMADALAGDFAGAALRTIVGKEIMIKAGTGKITKKEWELKVGNLRAELEDLSKLTVDRQRIEATDNAHRESIASKFNDAMNEIRRAFAQPEMIKAIGKLAKQLPKLAEVIAEVIAFIAENPLESLIAGGGINVAGGFASGAMQSIGESYLNYIKNASLFAKNATITAATTAATTTTTAATTAGMSLKTGAAAAVSALVAAKVGYEIGQYLWDKYLGPQSEKTAEASDDYENAVRKAEEIQRSDTATVEEKMAAVKAIGTEKQPGILSTENVAGQFASVFTGGESPLEKQERISDRAAKAHEALTKSMEQQAFAEYNRKQATVDAVQSLRRFTRGLDDATPPQAQVTGGARGTSHLENTPGSEPKGG